MQWVNKQGGNFEHFKTLISYAHLRVAEEKFGQLPIQLNVLKNHKIILNTNQT